MILAIVFRHCISLGFKYPPSDSSNDTESVSDKYSRLGQLILRLQDGDLERRYVLRFEKWLLTDQDALEYYVDFTNICAGLHCMLSKKTSNLS